MIKKILMWVAVAFIIYFIAFHPNDAAAVATSAKETIGEIATGFGTFFTELVT